MDVLVNVSLQTPTTDIAMRLLNEIHCKKILYLHDIYDFKWREWDFSGIGAFFKKCYYNLSRRIYYSYVHKYMSKYNLITHLSPFDISMRYVKRHKITQNLVLGNAALDSVFNKKHIKDTTTSPYFICIANYNDRKNQKFVLEAFYKTHFEREVKLVFIGKERNQYYYSLTEKKKLLDNLYGYRDVVFMTGVPREDTERLLSNAIAFVLGSKTEMFPVVIVEAMASSIPFISTDVGCVRYQPGGFIVNNADEMAYWMQFLIDNPLLGSKIGLIGYEYAHIKMTIESRINILLKAVELL